MVRRVARFLGGLSPRRRLVLQSATAAIGTYVAALVSVQVASVLKLGSLALIIFYIVISVAILMLLTLVAATVSDAVETYIEKRRIVLAAAGTQLGHCTVIETNKLVEDDDAHACGLVPHDPMAALQGIVEACHTTLQTQYGESSTPGGRISFEGTFMTMDPADQLVTVLAWANKEARRPDSLTRRRSNPHIYDRSVTADIYRSFDVERPGPRIIEDTSKEPYEELYPGQKHRIMSSIVYPIVSTSSDLLGTLVVHCDEADFFLRADAKYWIEFLELFGYRIALEKLRLDRLVTPQFAALPHVHGGGSS
jgi:GAF domain-containing protein